MKRIPFVLFIFFGFILSSSAQDNYEIQVYASPTVITHFDPISVQQHQLAICMDADFDPRWEFNAGYVIGLTPAIDRSIFKVILGRRFGGGKHQHHALGNVGRL